MDIEEQNSSDDRDGSTAPSFSQKLYNHRGVPLTVLSTFFFALQNVLIRYVEDEVHIMEISFVRYFFLGPLLIPFMVHNSITVIPTSRKYFLLLFLRGVFGMVAFNFFLFAMLYMRLGDATAIMMACPVFIGIFAKIFLKETFGIVDFSLVAFSICGLVLISQPPFLFGDENGSTSGASFFGAMLAFASCISFAIGNVTMSYLGKTQVSSTVILFYYSFVASCGTAVITTFFGGWSIPPCGKARFILIAIGIIHCIAQYLLTYSYSIEYAVIVGIVQTNEIIFAYVLEFFIVAVYPDTITLLGVAMVILASVLASLRKFWVSKQKRAAVESRDQTRGYLDSEKHEEDA
ncbi:Solute carrier family 35 member G1 [Holothuria leucospilota]|uniref:Solute carrier family 35 member G1 n=1 Tax=Holothuria leucospilota TaxID=206669 RepID=A0A9Q1HAJ0_HOLLE|nr:Solute carrier family 35 member G1 [Holothuria leucospilota]